VNINKPPSNMHFIADFKVHYVRIPAPNGEHAYMFYALVPGPICKMFFLFVDKMSITDLGIWSDRTKPNSPNKWIAHLRNINAESSIKEELFKNAKQLQKILVKLRLLNWGRTHDY
jgi:hypothetical protein